MTDVNADAWVSSTHRPMGFPEFVLIVACIMALNPLAMDMMLPALPQIGSVFNIASGNRLQGVLSAFMIGFGVGQFVIGPLSDRYGRRPILLAGMVVYTIASVLAVVAPSFETLLIARVAQGLGTAATRVIAVSIVRDCYAGRRMASVMSLVMMIFIAVPVLAPALGQVVMLAVQWRGIFVCLMIYGLLALLWCAWRLPETLPASERKSLALRDVLSAFRHTLTNRQTLGYALAAGGIQGTLFAYVFESQQVFTQIYHLGHYFPLAFAAIAIGIALAGFLNARFVGRLGMRVISHGALCMYVVVVSVMLVAARHGQVWFPLYMVLSALSMFGFGLMFANFTALAMEPQGHIAGTASSLFGSITTLLGIAIGYTIGQDFDGTLLPFATGSLLCTLATLAVVMFVEKGRLFHPHRPAQS
ncbi:MULTISPECIES: multidrug effflux MFS transporter [Rhodopseudomonas]|uniref:Bcr/CflA family efflux transporter n=1 Tax=Rhodopseudomonas palustris TaxID=1076 RepID=A0A0D7F470_RHOPL|nr:MULTISPECIES: multidrug effflux MFS transporter [Rhodopseudomonas]KIZ47610.1 major facilitator transporter [Rhodopseudomonas palustris]MDF3808968.1 multidrug effflux MFS transporter [Rhodopseudomonas sp. BAL398]WOK20034.1 multidrug effflux MFS transporter [Rhodopseudomonas sp. BAL398]